MLYIRGKTRPIDHGHKTAYISGAAKFSPKKKMSSFWKDAFRFVSFGLQFIFNVRNIYMYLFCE